MDCLGVNFQVREWEIVDLCDTEEDNSCFQCTAKAKYTFEDDQTTLFACGRHGDKSNRKMIPKPKKIKRDLSIFGNRLNSELNKRKRIMLNADKIVIENQPSLQNPFMKSIQIILFSWFLFHGSDVGMMSANNKLKVYGGPEIDMSHVKSLYSRRKKLGIAQCRILLKDDANAMMVMDSNKAKCDDLCDAYLMACYDILRYQDKLKKTKKKKTKKKASD